MKSISKKEIGSALAMAICAALLLASGCVDQAQEPETAEAEPVLSAEQSASEVSINAVASFVATCTHAVPTFDPGGSGALIRGRASACKRKNGSWNTVPQDWNGWCTGNLANCNGWISCDPYCP